MAARWTLEFTREAEGDLARLDRQIRQRIIDRLDWLQEHFDSIVPAVLGGEFSDFYKLRVGDWRATYRVNWNNRIITVGYIDRRDKIYKRK